MPNLLCPKPLLCLLALGLASACGAPPPPPADLDAAQATLVAAPAPTDEMPCEDGHVQSCKIWLGEHGDLSNCIDGLQVCGGGDWGHCIDESTFNDDPTLYGALTAS